MSDKPEALRLADMLEDEFSGAGPDMIGFVAARLLRDQHAEIQKLRNDLRNIQFAAELVRDYVAQLNDDCVEALKEGER